MNLFFVQQQPNEHDRSLIERLDMERQSTPLAMERAASAPAASTHTTKLDRFVIQSLFEYCGKPRIQIDLWDGTSFCEPESEPLAVVRLNNRTTLWKLISNVDIGFGDQFTEGNLEIEGDLVAVLCEIYTAKQRSIDDRSLVGKLFSKLTSKKARSNTLSSSKSNIHHHYDLGNEFYSLWLDSEAMQYTCAYFPYEAMSIEEAQIAKMDHVCKKLMLEPGQTVVEAGCGWGGLAVYMAKNYGVNVRSYNISHEQIVYAQNRAQELGLSDQVEYVEDDYRNIDGSFDAFVSVGMLEHVGLGNFAELGAVIDRCLKTNGIALIHSIGRNTAEQMSPWIEKRIFPGAYPPTIREMMSITEPYNFSVLDIENLRLHYAETLRHWLNRFEANQHAVNRMFDERFVRAWRLYLCGSIAAFISGSLQLFQMVLTRGQNNELARSREHIYSST